MIKVAVLLICVYLYLRRAIWSVLQAKKIGKVLDLYNEFIKANEQDKIRIFNDIARKRPYINDLLNSFYIRALSYDDIDDREKIKETYIALLEKLDEHEHNFTKSLHPKYFVKDIFFLPSSLLGFLLNRDFNKSSFFVSCCTWIATVLISAYAIELRILIDTLIKKIIEII